MRKLLLLTLLLVPFAAINVTVECPGSCISYVPAGGYATLNYTVNGSQLEDIFTQNYQFNITGSGLNTLLRLNLTNYSCNSPAAAFVGLDVLESAWTDEFLLVQTDLTASNTTLKLFCDGYNILRSQASWYDVGSPTQFPTSNISLNVSKYIVSGLNSSGTFAPELNTTSVVELGRGNLSVVNVSSSLNVTFYDKSFSLLNWTTLPVQSTFVHMDFGQTTTQYGTEYVYALSYGNSTHGNLTIFNESFAPVDTLVFNRSQGVTIADINGDSVNEIVGCFNTTTYNVTALRYDAGGWIYNYTNITCVSGSSERFSSFEKFKPTSANDSIVTFDSSDLIVIVFNETVEVQTTSLTNIEDIATLDADGDGDDEVAVAFSNGDVKLYNVSLPLTINEIDYFGSFMDITGINFETDFLVDFENISLFTVNPLATSGNVSYSFPDSVPVKIQLNFSTGGTGNVTLNVSSGEWYHNTTWTSAQDLNMTLWPSGNGTLEVEFILDTADTSDDLWLDIRSVSVEFANSSFVNNSVYNAYSPETLTVTTSIKTNGAFQIIGANFTDSFTLDSFTAYIDSGNYSFELNGTSSPLSFSKPIVNMTTSSYWTGANDSIQGSQSESNFSTIIGFRDLLHVVTSDTNLSVYGNVTDYCSLNHNLVYVWGNATFLNWDDSSLGEIGNVTGEFSECWLTESSLYLVNSSGGIETYNHTLTSTGNFSNANFLVGDVVVNDKIYATNSTHLANITNNDFTLIQDWSGRIFKTEFEYHNLNATVVSDYPGSDIDGDSLWEKLYKGIVTILGNLARIITLPSGDYASWGTNISIAFDNGTFVTNDIALTTPSIGRFTSFSSNVSYTSEWVATNFSEWFDVNITVLNFIENDTTTLNDFEIRCGNDTFTQIATMVRHSNHSFSFTNSTYAGTYTCEVYPQWTTLLPKTFSSYEFTLYVDSTTPLINNITHPSKISATNPFNVTINVTEDIFVNQFVIADNNVTVNNFILIDDVDYQIYNLSLTMSDWTDAYPYNVSLNISAVDYSGKSSNNFTTENLTVFNDHPPDIDLIILNNNVQGFTSEPINISITVTSDSGNNNNISYINATLWQGSNLQDYQETADLNKRTHTLWFNETFSSAGEYTVKVNSADMTNFEDEETANFLRYDEQETQVSGYWWSSTTGTTEFQWDHSYTSGSITDNDEASKINNSKTFNITIDTPYYDIDSWFVKYNASTSSSLRLKYLNRSFDFKGGVYYASNLYAINVSSATALDTILFAAMGISVGSSEKLCFYTCSEFDLVDQECDTSWEQERCGSAGDGTEYLSINRDDSQLNYITSGTGFKFVKIAIESSTTDEETETQTTTVSTPTAVVTITTATSKTIEVGSCSDVVYTIKNTGSASATLEKITASNFYDSELTYTVLSDINFPYTLQDGSQLTAILSFCPLVDRLFNPNVCVKVGTTNKCVPIKIYGVMAVNETAPEELNLTVNVEMFEDEYIVFVNSSGGPVQGAIISLVYPDGTSENYTTNVFGKINFKPTDDDFTVTVFYGNETLHETVETLKKILSEGLTLPRILFDLLIIGLLMVLGIFLDEKML